MYNIILYSIAIDKWGIQKNFGFISSKKKKCMLLIFIISFSVSCNEYLNNVFSYS